MQSYFKLGKTARGPLAGNCPPGCPNLPASPICFAENDKLNFLDLRQGQM